MGIKKYFLVVLLGFLPFLFYSVAQAKSCDESLQKKSLIFKANVEPGSIEHQNPGVVGKIRLINDSLNKLASDQERAAARKDNRGLKGLTAQVRKIVEDFESLKFQIKDQRFLTMHLQLQRELNRYIASFEQAKYERGEMQAIQSRTHNMTAALWELMVACLFDGEKIYLGQLVEDLVPQDFAALGIDPNDKNFFYFNREIDIAILQKDGTWRWIEVKNWGYDRSLEPEAMIRLFEQSWGQDNIRRLLGNLKIRLELMMRYELPDETHRTYLEKAAYEQIHFLFR